MMKLFAFFFLSSIIASSLPDSISFLVTVRSFMASYCRAGLPPNFLNTYCPDDDTIRQAVESGHLSGHPDFERLPSDPQYSLYKFHQSAIASYNNSFAKYGKQFPITAGRGFDPAAKPYVLSELSYGTTGIGKMEYCKFNFQEGYACDVATGNTKRSVMNNISFSSWYEDSRMYNRRSGYRQKLSKQGSQYVFDAQNDVYNPVGNMLYDPILSNNLSEQAWPLSKLEKDGFDTSNGSKTCPDAYLTGKQTSDCFFGKFWFTTEIHTSFHYLGGEKFDFSGDDDVHIFINNRLAINLGGQHSVIQASIDLDTYSRELNITKGEIYQFDMFHVERQTKGSNYAITTTLSEICNVVNSDLRSNGLDVFKGIDWPNESFESTWKFIGGPGFGLLSNNRAILMAPSISDVTSYMFSRNRQNVGSGFSMSFDFRTTGTGHGFSFVVHNRDRGLRNFNGGTGPNLGIKNFDKSFALVFDACPRFPNCSSGFWELGLYYPDQGLNGKVLRSRRVYDPDVIQNWADGAIHHVEIMYYDRPSWIEIYVDNSLRLVQHEFYVKDILQGSNAYVGFTSSSSRDSQMSVEILSVATKTVKVKPSNTLLLNQQLLPFTFIAGKEAARFQIQTQDACGNLIGFGGFKSIGSGRLVPSATNTNNLRSLQSQNNTLLADIMDENNGIYSFDFRTDVIGSYDLFMAFGNTCFWNGTEYLKLGQDCWTLSIMNATIAIPYSTTSPTGFADSQPVPFPWAIFLGVGIGLISILCCVCCLVLGMSRYRNKWRQDKKYIESGQMAVLDRGLDLNTNPLGRKLAELSQKLQASTSEVLKLRARNGPEEDKTETIQSMITETKSLKEEVKSLKRRQQIEEQLELTKSNRPSTALPGGSQRVQFLPQSVVAHIDIFSDLPPPPPTLPTAVFVPKPNPKASFLVSISQRDIDYIVETANFEAPNFTGGDVFGQFYENGDSLVMHATGPGLGSISNPETFLQSPDFLADATSFLGQHSAFRMGVWMSKPLDSLLDQVHAARQHRMEMGNPKWFLFLVAELAGIAEEKMTVSIIPYRFALNNSDPEIGDLYIFQDDHNEEANQRHSKLEVMRRRPVLKKLNEGKSAVIKRKMSDKEEVVPPPLPRSRPPPPPIGSDTVSGSGVLNLTPRRFSLTDDDSHKLLTVEMEDQSPPSKKKGFFSQQN